MFSDEETDDFFSPSETDKQNDFFENMDTGSLSGSQSNSSGSSSLPKSQSDWPSHSGSQTIGSEPSFLSGSQVLGSDTPSCSGSQTVVSDPPSPCGGQIFDSGPPLLLDSQPIGSDPSSHSGSQPNGSGSPLFFDSDPPSHSGSQQIGGESPFGHPSPTGSQNKIRSGSSFGSNQMSSTNPLSKSHSNTTTGSQPANVEMERSWIESTQVIQMEELMKFEENHCITDKIEDELNFIFEEDNNEAYLFDKIETSDPKDSFDESLTETFEIEISNALDEKQKRKSVKQLAESLFTNEKLKKTFLKMILKSLHQEFESYTSNCSLNSEAKKDRNYLLQITPENITKEFIEKSPLTAEVLCQILWGQSTTKANNIPQLRNGLSSIVGIGSKFCNRMCNGWQLMTGMALRDGGLREDSLLVMTKAGISVAPETLRRYNSNVLSKNWNDEQHKNRIEVCEAFKNVIEALNEKKKLSEDFGPGDERVLAIDKKVEYLFKLIPPKYNYVWDNLNLRSKVREEGRGHNPNNYVRDYMASMCIKERINATHLHHFEKMSTPTSLQVEDFLVGLEEKHYLLDRIIHLQIENLRQRFPNAFSSCYGSIQRYASHQFEKEMTLKTEEAAGPFWTLSESNTEDVIEMMKDWQKYYAFVDSLDTSDTEVPQDPVPVSTQQNLADRDGEETFEDMLRDIVRNYTSQHNNEPDSDPHQEPLTTPEEHAKENNDDPGKDEAAQPKKAFVRMCVSGDNKTEKNMRNAQLSKVDENCASQRLDLIIPEHEYLHQEFVMCDMESKLFRGPESKVLKGGAHYNANLLKRTKARDKSGKESRNEMKDFYRLKQDVYFTFIFFKTNGFDPDIDNTPDCVKRGTNDEKREYLKRKVGECLKKIMPEFEEVVLANPVDMTDFPLKDKRRLKDSEVMGQETDLALSALHIPGPGSSSGVNNASKFSGLIEAIDEKANKRRQKSSFRCRICKFTTNFQCLINDHVPRCYNEQLDESDIVVNDANSTTDEIQLNIGVEDVNSLSEGTAEQNTPPKDVNDENDYFKNYKNGEFYFDSLFSVGAEMENCADGLGLYILSKAMLPMFYALGHSNYTVGCFWKVVRVKGILTPMEGLLEIWERFSNMKGGEGKNMYRDKRMELRIGRLKVLIENLGRNINVELIQLLNKTVDIKEQFYVSLREGYQVPVRSGYHTPKPDDGDFKILWQQLEELDAAQDLPGRKFGNYQYPRNLLDHWNKASFVRYVNSKIRETIQRTSFSPSKDCLVLPD